MPPIKLKTLLLTIAGALIVSGSNCYITGEGTNPPIQDGSLPDSSDGGGDAGPCGGCSGATPLCDTSTNTCVACLLNTDCTDPASSVCSAGACTGCVDNSSCSHLTSTNTCDTADSTCVECTIATESTDCGAKSCNPTTRTCTTTDRASVLTCEPCVADSECSSTDDRCIATEFNMVANGAYCLKRASATCAEPFLTFINGPSLSGKPAENYCGFSQSTTSCAAIRGLQTSAQCMNGMDSECSGEGALCRMVGAGSNRCTYSCSAPDECLASGNGSTCGNGSTSGPMYCGG